MSAPAPATPTAVRSPSSPSDRQSSYHRSEMPHRSQSTSARSPATPTALNRANSHNSNNRPPSSSRQASNLANVARRDFEQSNVARPPSSSRRSASIDRQDRQSTSERPSYTESPRSAQRTSSRSAPQSRQDADGTPSQPAAANGVSATDDSSRTPTGGATRKRTMVTAQTGQWALGKTIGAGSMGKVKLARNMETGEQVAVKIVPRYSQDEHRTPQDRERADHSKEVRTAREAAITSLVNHPYICGMRDVVRTNYHWYMLFEYVNGGQMLDYIISHGRLKEKQARKFGRQIASALDYCHRNSIVHRDLKIENILISKTGDIKIIDFGLSNLFSPRAQLKTFCGSLYFAAPELLQAKQYTGPEVDIWSFGIVLYVLVCGKVPFDDQSMPQLHAKIKKGVVEYPPWLSNECKHVISRMLITDPKSRATLAEIMNHPWMTKGFSGLPDNYLPHREPLQLPLDQNVIDKMQGFDFGTSEYISRQLEAVLESEDYLRAVRQAAKRGQTHTEGEKKRGVFDFYQRRKSASSRDTLQNPSSEAVHFGEDPVFAFSPLISIYYLVREKQEREKVESNPGALTMPQSPGEKPLKMPDLPAPEAAYTNSAAYEMAGEAPTGGRSRPRARTQGEDEIKEGSQPPPQASPVPVVQTPPPDPTPTKKEGAVGGLLRRFSTRRGPKEPDRERSPHLPPAVAVTNHPEPSSSPKKSFSVRKTRDRDTPPSSYREVTLNQPDLLAPPGSSDGTKPTTPTRTKGLGRSVSVNSGDLRRRFSRRGVSEGATMQRPSGVESERSSISDQKARPSERGYEDYDLQSQQRASRTKSVGHSRRDSMQTRRLQRRNPRESDVPEETDQDLAEDEHTAPGRATGPETLKPIYLKGLFSVSTTSSKPLSFIRDDLIRVLTQLGVEFHEMKSGFDCRHLPSIDLNKVVDTPGTPGTLSEKPSGHKRKISFAGIRNHEKVRDELATEKEKEKTGSLTPRSSHTHPQVSRSTTGYTTTSEDDPDSEDDPAARASRQASRRAPSRPAGETTTQVQSDLGQSMILQFEILVVKVPLLSMHGLQFKKVEGGTWQYKKMAETILAELKL